MDKKKIAFVGEPCCEVVLYLGQVLEYLGYPLTVFDLSPLRDLVNVVPNVQVADGAAEYLGVKIVWGDLTMEEVPEYSLFYFGYNVRNPLIAKCDEVWMFTDYQVQHIAALKMTEMGTLPRFLVYLTEGVGRAAIKFIQNEFADLQINEDNLIEVDATSADFRFKCQYNSAVRFKGASKLLATLATKLLEVDFDKSEINAAIKGVK